MTTHTHTLARDLRPHFASTGDSHTNRKRLSGSELLQQTDNGRDAFYSMTSLIASPEVDKNKNGTQMIENAQTHTPQLITLDAPTSPTKTQNTQQRPIKGHTHAHTRNDEAKESNWRNTISKRITPVETECEHSRAVYKENFKQVANVVNDLSVDIQKVDTRAENNCWSHTKAVELSPSDKLKALKADVNTTADIVSKLHETNRDLALQQKKNNR